MWVSLSMLRITKLGMSVVAIRCPTCGSAAASTTTPNEYECSHCRSRFQIVRPADATVVTDARAHHCPICGRAVQTTQSFRCTECGRIDFCNNCVATIPSFGTERFVCRACMTQKGWACSSCGGYAMTVCINCKRRACGQHLVELFGLRYIRNGKVIGVDYLSCPNCKGQLCANCVQEKSGIFSTKYYCKKCAGELLAVSGASRTCKVCGHIVDTPSGFCTNCGRALS